jgi:hypothetical protein
MSEGRIDFGAVGDTLTAKITANDDESSDNIFYGDIVAVGSLW